MDGQAKTEKNAVDMFRLGVELGMLMSDAQHLERGFKVEIHEEIAELAEAALRKAGRRYELESSDNPGMVGVSVLSVDGMRYEPYELDTCLGGGL